jgi:hypothetical protein
VRLAAIVFAFGLSGNVAFAATVPVKVFSFGRDGAAERPSVTSGIGRGSSGKVRKAVPVDNEKPQNSSTR